MNPRRSPARDAGAAASAPDIRRSALDLLARREHSAAELRSKLLQKFGADAPVDAELARLEVEHLLDDTRFAEAFVRMHRTRGHGPIRILHELAQRGVAATLAEQCVAPRDSDWIALARAWRERRFGEQPPRDASEWQRQARHLQARGFSAEQVRGALREPRD